MRVTVDTILRDHLAQGPLSVTGYHQNSHSTIRVVFSQQGGIFEFTHLLLVSWYKACVYGEVADDLRRRRQDPDLENASVDRTDIAAMTGPKEVTEDRVRVSDDRLDEWRLGACSLKCQNETTERTLQNTVDQTRRLKTIPRNTPRYSHDGLGLHQRGGETDTCIDFPHVGSRPQMRQRQMCSMDDHTRHSQS